MQAMKLRSRRLPASLLAVAIAGCGGTDPSPSPSDAGPPGGSAAPATIAATPSPNAGTSASTSDGEAIAQTPPPLALEEVAAGLESPINITGTPDGWLLVNERAGRVVAIDPVSGAAEVSLDISDRVRGEGEQGLLGLAVHPDWPADPRAFVHYSNRDGDTVLSEFRLTDEPAPPRLDPTTERVLLTQDQPYPNHNGGQVAFGHDGFLYLGLGDGGSGGDPQGHGQDRQTILGDVLRIDVDAATRGEAAYAIPADNPHADGGDGAPEIFVSGVRNPWRFSFDRASGLLWIADVGQNATEEVNRIDPSTEAGANLGWNVMEASHCFATPDCDVDGLTLPVVEYGRDLGCSVTGGYVYRGSAIPDLAGWYLFSDYCTGTLFGIPSDVDGIVGPRSLLETGASVSTFGEGADGELYLGDLESGTIYRIVDGG
jgi:glucose/arabinose dehydrogenase